ncbi:MAG: S-layer homology domain-containing protein [Clostridia bacterium]|nr:S-layer homology domain-containing protein [Clostridia bacterium]
MKKIISFLIVFTIIFSYCFIPQDTKAAFLDTIEPPRYWEDPQQITDENFFGVYDREGEVWKNPGLLCYSNPLLSNVKSSAMKGDYDEAKENLRNALSEKFASFPKKAFSTSEKSSYISQLLFKHNIISVNSPLDVLEVENEWGWVDVDISSQITSSTKEKSFYFVAVEKDDSVIEISSCRGEAQYAPKIEAVVNSNVVSSVAVMDAITSAGRNTYVTSDNLTKDNPGILKVAESSTSIGGGPVPVDENTFRTYIRFNLEDIIKPGDTVSKATLKIYTRINGNKEKKQMLLYSLGSTLWTGTLKWSDTQVQNTVFVYDGDDAINWGVTVENTPTNVVEDPTNLDGIFSLISRAELYDDPEGLYYWMCRLMSYIHDVGMPPALSAGGGSMSLRTAGRVSAIAGNMRYFIDSEIVPTDILMAILKHVWLMLDWFEDIDNFDYGSNFGIYQTRGLLYGAITYDDIFERGKYWTDLALNRYTEMSSNIMYSDGTCKDASMSYARDSLSLLLGAYEVAESVGKGIDYIKFPAEYEANLRKLAKYILDSTYNLYDTQFGDTTEYTSKTSSESYRKYIDDEHYAWSYSNGYTGKAPDDYTSILYPVGGKVAMRSDWSTKGLFLHTNNDRFLYSHAHDDDLSIIAFAYGQYLLVDPLYYTYTWNNDKAWLAGKTGHNLVVINKNEGFTGQRTSSALGYYSAGPIERWETNDGFDFVSMVEEKVGEHADIVEEDVYHTRDIMFVKDKFWIVTDLLEPKDKDAYNRYEQRWHFLPEAKIKIDPETMVLETTGFRANMKIYPVDPYDYVPVDNYNEDATGIQEGLYSPKRDQLVKADYAYYLKSDVKGDTSFATVLFPMQEGSEYEVATDVVNSNLKSTDATAINIEYEKEGTNAPYIGTYFNLHNSSLAGENMAGNYSTDARLLYAETLNGKYSSLDLANGTHVKDAEKNIELISSSDAIDGITVSWDSKGIHIDSMSDTDLTKLTVYTNGDEISNVYYKGAEVSFKQQGRYVYFGDSPIINDTSSNPEETPDDETSTQPNVPSTNPETQAKPQGSPSGNKHGVSGGGFTPAPVPDVPKPDEHKFPDVANDRWSAQYIKELYSENIISGYEDGTFRPENNITREEFLKLVLESLKIPMNDSPNVFTDVVADSWYEKYVSSAKGLAIINGIKDNVFGVGEYISRQDMAVIIVRALEYKNKTLKQHIQNAIFVDEDDISDYALSAVKLLSDSQIISGNEQKEFMPNGMATREQVAKIICLVLKNIN